MIRLVDKKLLWAVLISVVMCELFGTSLGIRIRRGSAAFKGKDSASVAANGVECAAIGGKILQQMKGNAADAGIATLFCEGVAITESCGLGGGLTMTIYTKSTGKVETLIARETAPNAATEDMFAGVKNVTGIRSIAVPGELKGMWELHQRYGSLPWRTLIEPSINLCLTGHVVTEYFARVLQVTESRIKNQPTLAEVFVNPETNDVWIEGDIIKRPKLAETLELIAAEGADTLYNNGTLAQLLVSEIQELGGIITTKDLMDYTVRWEESISTTFLKYTVHTVPPPASGSVLIMILNVLNGFLPSVKNLTFYQRFIECFKFAFAKRTELADYYFVPETYKSFQKMLDLDYARDIRSKIEDDRTYQDFEHYGARFSIPDDHGTAHISVVGPNGDAVAVTTSINQLFGSCIRSRRTGIILNNVMDDFSTPGVTNAYGVQSSPDNYIVPGKRPLSSMCPTIVIDEHGDVKLVIGGAGRTKITTSVAYTLISILMFDEPLDVLLNEKRFHHQLVPMAVYYDDGFNETILQGLIGIGHKVDEDANARLGFVTVTAIERDGDKLTPISISQRSRSSFVF